MLEARSNFGLLVSQIFVQAAEVLALKVTSLSLASTSMTCQLILLISSFLEVQLAALSSLLPT